MGPVTVAGTIRRRGGDHRRVHLSFLGSASPPAIPTWDGFLFDAKDNLDFAPTGDLPRHRDLPCTVLSITT